MQTLKKKMAAPIVTPVTHVVFDVDGVLIGMILKYSATSLTMRDEVWFVNKIKWQLSTRKFNMLHFQFEASKLTAITESEEFNGLEIKYFHRIC